MAWTALSIDGLRSRLVTDELDKLLEECPDPDAKIAEVLGQVANEFVARINAGRRKRTLPAVEDTGLFLPGGCHRHSYTIARQLLSESFPSLAEFNGDDRKAAMEAANTFLIALSENNADSDDTGAESYIGTATGGPTFGGKTQYDFTTLI
jgi:hypothetical protein